MANFIVEDIKKIFKDKQGILSQLIVINVAVFIIFNILNSFGLKLDQWFALPDDGLVFLTRPWSIFTYMFMHGGFFHILFNMLWLYWIGQILVEYINPNRLLGIYILGGIVGGLAYLLLFSIVGIKGTYLVGASAGVMAIVAAAGTLLPDYSMRLFLIGPVRMKYLAIGIIVLTSLLDFPVNMGGKIAHLGGAALGYLFIRQLQKGTDYSILITKVFEFFQNFFVSKPKMKVAYTAPKPKKKSRKQKATYQTQEQKQRKIDAILDKISKSGYDSLSAEEKEYLFNMSNDKK